MFSRKSILLNDNDTAYNGFFTIIKTAMRVSVRTPLGYLMNDVYKNNSKHGLCFPTLYKAMRNFCCHGKVTPMLLVRSGLKSNLTETLCMPALFAILTTFYSQVENE